MAYLLDSNVFITARNQHYGRRFCPGFWDWIVAANQAGFVRSVERVRKELVKIDDDLKSLAKQWGRRFSMPPRPDDRPALGRVTNWIRSRDWEPSAIHAFLQEADYYLIGQALAGGHKVVTHEVPSNSTKQIKIPNVCIGVGVKCMSPFDMLRAENVRLVLDPAVRRALQKALRGRSTGGSQGDLFGRREGQ